jgi:hypothetical protein
VTALFTANAWEAGIRSELQSHELTFADFRTTDLTQFEAIIPLCLADQRYINELLQDNPTLPALVPSERCMELCHDKAGFMRHLNSLNLGEDITPDQDPKGFPYILKPNAGEFGVDPVITKSANDEDIHADKVNSSQYLKEHYIAGNQEYCSHIIAAGNTIRYMGSVMYTFDADVHVKGINKSPNATEIVDHSQYAAIFERILASIDYEGFCCFDYKIVNGRPCVFELNPRYGATMSRFIQEALPVYCQVIEERRGVRHSFA